MSTPNFKLLANALRLGQPPDPLLAFRVLVEVIQQQETELAELRQRVSMLTSRLQFTEAKASRVEAASLQGMGEPSVRPPTFGPPPTAAAPAHPGEQTGEQRAAQQQPVMPQPQPAMQQIPAMPPIPKEAKKRVDPHPDLAPIDESDVTLGTLVVARADIDAVVRNVSENEAPYPLSPPGGHRPATETSGMPFKAARPLDPTGGTLKGSPAKNQSRPPPPGIPAIPAAPMIPAAPKIPSKPLSAPPPIAAAPAPRGGPARVLPRPRPEPSAPYIAIEDMAADDTFSSTSDNLEVVYPESLGKPREKDGAAPAIGAAPSANTDPPRHQAPSLLDDGSFDDSAMTILTRRPNGQGR